MEERHQQELQGAAVDGGGEAEAAAPPHVTEPEPAVIDTEEEVRLRKQEKARRKKEAKKEKERQHQEDLEKEAAEAGPSMRAVELQALDLQLKPLSLKVVEIPSDGNCLYRAVAAHCGSDYSKIRKFLENVLKYSSINARGRCISCSICFRINKAEYVLIN
jgi:hypothetical protein